MFERFTSDARTAVEDARRCAVRLGAESVEPVHLLIALADVAGLDAETLEEAAERDSRALLAAVGVMLEVDPRRAGIGASDPDFAPGTKRALELALRSALEHGDRRIDSTHVLRGLLRIDTGRLDEVLQDAGTDREALAALLERAPG